MHRIVLHACLLTVFYITDGSSTIEIAEQLTDLKHWSDLLLTDGLHSFLKTKSVVLLNTDERTN